MSKSFYYVIILFLILGCTDKAQINNSIKIELYESYDIAQLFPSILESNLVIRKKQIDSLANLNTGIALVDKINKQAAATDSFTGNSVEDFPLFHVLQPNMQIDNDGKGYIDSSSIIGLTQDTVALKKYLLLVDSLFPADLKWKISGHSKDKTRILHAIKENGSKIQLADTDVDSLIISPVGMDGLGGTLEKISDLTGLSSYLITIKLKKELNGKLGKKVYSLLFKVNNHEYSGSIVNFESNPTQYVMIGELEYVDLKALMGRFEDKIKMRKIY